MEIAESEARILITNDRGFGEKYFENDARITASFFFAWVTSAEQTRSECSVNSWTSTPRS